MIIFTALLAILVGSEPTLAVTNGDFDGDGHPHVGLMVALNEAGYPMWRCTGSLISSGYFLTAGHCLEDPAAAVTIWFDSDVEGGRPGNGYPFVGDITSNKLFVHPEYYSSLWLFHDLGIVELDSNGPPLNQIDTFGKLPPANLLSQLAVDNQNHDITFAAVGYGLQDIRPTIEANLIRMVANPYLIQVDTNIFGLPSDFSIVTSSNAVTGGTCFGDSGGPRYLTGPGDEFEDGDIIAGVTSYGVDPNCASPGGVYRIDQVDDLNWLRTFFVPLEPSCNIDGICQPYLGESCLGCEDCAGIQEGNPVNRFCCGGGGGRNPVDCYDDRCVCV